MTAGSVPVRIVQTLRCCCSVATRPTDFAGLTGELGASHDHAMIWPPATDHLIGGGTGGAHDHGEPLPAAAAAA